MASPTPTRRNPTGFPVNIAINSGGSVHVGPANVARLTSLLVNDGHTQTLVLLDLDEIVALMVALQYEEASLTKHSRLRPTS